MQNLTDLKKGYKLHHFNIIESGNEPVVSDLCKKVLNFNTQANPNYFYKKYDSFLVDNARDLITQQNRKHKTGESMIFVIDCGSINTQAQNSLLKIFEEGQLDVYFFLLIPQVNLLLPTLISRAVIYKADKKLINNESYEQEDINKDSDDKQSKTDFPNLEELRKMSLKDKMKLSDNLISKYKKEQIDKSELKNFINSIIVEMNNEILNSDTKSISKIKKINQLTEYFDNNGAHLKSLLDFFMLTI